MQIKCSREAFLPELKLLNSVIERKQTLPILSNALLQIKDGFISVTATDLECGLKILVEEILEQEEFSITVPLKKFTDVCKAMPKNARFEMVFMDGTATIICDRSRFRLNTLPAEDYPAIEQIAPDQRITLESGRLKALLSGVHHAQAIQDIRYYLNGMLFDLDAGKCVATDGHRLAVAALDGPIGSGQVIIPRKAVKTLMGMLEYNEKPVVIEISNSYCRFTVTGLVFTTKLIDGKYPDYARVVPEDRLNSVLVDSDELKAALQRASVLSMEKHKGVNLTFEEDILRLHSHNSAEEEANENILIEYKGETVKIGFNIQYLLEALNAIAAEKVTISFQDGENSITMVGNDQTHVIMPMRT